MFSSLHLTQSSLSGPQTLNCPVVVEKGYSFAMGKRFPDCLRTEALNAMLTGHTSFNLQAHNKRVLSVCPLRITRVPAEGKAPLLTSEISRVLLVALQMMTGSTSKTSRLSTSLGFFLSPLSHLQSPLTRTVCSLLCFPATDKQLPEASPPREVCQMRWDNILISGKQRIAKLEGTLTLF